MKKFFRIIAGIIVALIALMIVVPYVFKDQLLNKTQQVINENVEARVSFDDVSVSLFRRFPNLNVGIEGLSLSGKGAFEKDTLVQFKTFHAEVDLLSMFKKRMVLEGVYMEEPRVHAKIAADSTVNWDIMKTEEEAPEPEAADSAAAPSDYRVDLKTFQITQGHVIFEDVPGNMHFSAEDLSFAMDGDLGADSSAIALKMHVATVNFTMGAIRYVNQADVQFNAEIGANIQEGRYHIRDNRFAINGLELNFDGLVSMEESGRINTDITFATSKTDFKSLLSLVPAIYMQDFQEVETAGELALNGKVSGYYQEEVWPSLDVNLQVEEAMFSYPDLPGKAENIQVSLQTYFDGQAPDRTRLNLERFHIEMAGSPFDASLSLHKPISNLTVEGAVKGQIVLNNLSDVVPMEETQLRGVIDSDLKFAGSMDMVEQERYNEFQAEGNMKISDLYFSSPDLPDAVTVNAEMVFTPQFLDLKNLTAQIGESDLQFSGKMTDYIAYALEDGVLRGDFNLSSQYLNVNQFLSEDQEEVSPDTAAPAEMTLFEVPERMDFKMQANMDRILYDRMQINDAKGTVMIRDRAIYLDGFAMDLFEGRLMADGEYNTQDTARPYVNFNMGLEDLQVKNALKTFRMMDTLAPILKKAEGDISMDLQYMSELQKNMMPDMPTVDGFGELRSKKIRVKGSRSIGKVLSALEMSQSADQSFKDLKINFLMRQGELIVKPFDVSIADIGMTISGSQRYDQTMDYDIAMRIPRSKFGGAANQVIDNLVARAASKGLDLNPGETVNVQANLTGTFSDPKVGLDFGKATGSGTQDVREQVKEQIEQAIDQKKEEAEQKVREEASKEARQIIQEAEERAERIQAEAQKAAKKVRQEADKRAKQVEEEAKDKNFLVRKAAEESAKKIRQEADKRARQLTREAERRADSIIEQAKRKAAEIEEQ